MAIDQQNVCGFRRLQQQLIRQEQGSFRVPFGQLRSRFLQHFRQRRFRSRLPNEHDDTTQNKCAENEHHNARAPVRIRLTVVRCCCHIEGALVPPLYPVSPEINKHEAKGRSVQQCQHCNQHCDVQIPDSLRLQSKFAVGFSRQFRKMQPYERRKIIAQVTRPTAERSSSVAVGTHERKGTEPKTALDWMPLVCILAGACVLVRPAQLRVALGVTLSVLISVRLLWGSVYLQSDQPLVLVWLSIGIWSAVLAVPLILPEVESRAEPRGRDIRKGGFTICRY